MIVLIVILRTLAGLLAFASLFGVLAFWSTHHPVSLGVPVAVLLLSLTPVKVIQRMPWLLGIPLALTVADYSIAGVPFLRESDYGFARFLHFMVFALGAFLFARAGVSAWRGVMRRPTA